jgi:hypothetical protein
LYVRLSSLTPQTTGPPGKADVRYSGTIPKMSAS